MPAESEVFCRSDGITPDSNKKANPRNSYVALYVNYGDISNKLGEDSLAIKHPVTSGELLP